VAEDLTSFLFFRRPITSLTSERQPLWALLVAGGSDVTIVIQPPTTGPTRSKGAEGGPSTTRKSLWAPDPPPGVCGQGVCRSQLPRAPRKCTKTKLVTTSAVSQPVSQSVRKENIKKIRPTKRPHFAPNQVQLPVDTLVKYSIVSIKTKHLAAFSSQTCT